MSKYYFVYLIFLLKIVNFIYANNNLQLCGNPTCTEIISKAIVELEFELPTDLNDRSKYLKLYIGDYVNVLAKETQSSESGLWYGECNNAFGYFPKNVVREEEVINKNPIYVTPSNFVDEKDLPLYDNYKVQNEIMYRNQIESKQQMEHKTEDSNQELVQENNVASRDIENEKAEIDVQLHAEGELEDVEENNDTQKQLEAEEALKLEAERKRKLAEEEAKQKQQEEERLKMEKEEEERLKKLELEKKQKEEEEQKRKAEEEEKERQLILEKKQKEEEERLNMEKKQKEEEQQRKLELEKKQKEELERQKQLEIENKKKEEEKKRQEELERQKRLELEKKQREEELRQKQLQEQERQRKLDLEKKQKEEAERKKREAEEEERKYKEAIKKQMDEEYRKRVAEEEAEKKRQEEIKKKEAEEAERKRQEEIKKKEAEEEAERKRQEEIRKKEAEEEAERKRQEEIKKKEAEEEEERKRQELIKAQEAELKLKLDLEKKLKEEAGLAEQKRKEQEAEEAERKRQEEIRKKEAEEEAERKRQEEIKKKEAEEEEERKRQELIKAQEAELKLKLDLEKKLKEEAGLAEQKRKEQEDEEKLKHLLSDLEKQEQEKILEPEESPEVEKELSVKEPENIVEAVKAEEPLDSSVDTTRKSVNSHFESKFNSLNKKNEENVHVSHDHHHHHHHHHHYLEGDDEEQHYHDAHNNETEILNEQPTPTIETTTISPIQLEQNESNHTSTNNVNSNKKQMKILPNNLLYANKFCADLKPLKDIFNHIESYYSPFLLILPESVQLLLLENTPIMGMSMASCLLVLTSALSFITVLFFCLHRTDRTKMNSNSNLNEAILSLELKIQDLNFEKQTFTTRIIDLEKELSDKQVEKETIEKSLNEIRETNLLNGENDKKTIDILNKKHDTLKLDYKQICESESSLKQELELLREENKRLEIENLNLINTTNNSVELDKYEQLELKVNNLLSEREVIDQQIEDYKKDFAKQEETIESLKSDLNSKENRLNVLQNFISNKSSQNLPTISEDEGVDVVDSGSGFLNNLMDVANLQNKIQVLEQQLQNEDVKLSVSENSKEKLESEIEMLRKDFDKISFENKELSGKIKEYEMQIKLMGELRIKDLEISVKKYSELDAQFKKKSSEADRNSYFLEQLNLKQERIQELETQIGRIEKNSTQERQTFEKQAHENWLSARKYEKEAKEAKHEAKLWMEKCKELEQYRENTTIVRPLPINKIPPSAYMQPISNHINDSIETSPPTKSTHESSVERERPPSTSSNSGYIPQQQSQPTYAGISPNMPPHPLFMRGLPPPHMYRPPFPGPFMAPRMPMSMTPQFDRNSTSSPDVNTQFMNRQQPLSVPPHMMNGSHYTSPLPLLQPSTVQNSQQSPSQHNNSYLYQNNDTSTNNSISNV